jgi:cell wall-associated NlpC family hydrolase
MLWVETPSAVLIAQALFTTPTDNKGLEYPELWTPCEKKAKRISIDRVKKGDLIFFRTSRKRKLTHAGIVVGTKRGVPQFIHASSSQGVVISTLDNTYWKKKYAQTRRLLKK